MPPSEASAPGSIGKNRPWSRRCSLSCLRVTPGSTTQSRSSAWTARTRFMSRRSIETPPNGALTWPSSEVPVPNGDDRHAMRARRCARSAARPRSICGNTTASGGWFATQVSGVAVLLAHRLRGDEPVADDRRQARRSAPLDRAAVALEFLRRLAVNHHCGILALLPATWPQRPQRVKGGLAALACRREIRHCCGERRR